MTKLNFSEEDSQEPEQTNNDSEFEVLPNGEYLMQVDFAHTEDTKKTNPETGNPVGEKLCLEMTIIEDNCPYQGRKVWENHLFKHEQINTQKVGKYKITQLAKAVGKWEDFKKEGNPIIFQGRPFRAELYIEQPQKDKITKKIKVNPSTGEAYKPKNRVGKYKPYQESSVPVGEKPIGDDIPF